MNEQGSSSSLTQQGQQNGQVDEAAMSQHNPAPQPPPFNPIPSHHSQVGSSLGHSVVPDLMKIYESLTQSSTPQLPPSQQLQPAAPAKPASQYQTQQIVTQQFQYQQPTQYQAPLHQGQALQYTQYVQPQQQGYYSQHQQPSATYGRIHGNVSVPAIPESVYQPPQEPLESTQGGGRSLRKRSLDKSSDKGNDSTKRKKGNQSDGRWSKRFSWPDDLHRDFVAAIFDVGLKHSSPSALQEFMPKHDQITSERIKSHLQKYRLHRAKSKKEFMSSYEATLGKFQVSGADNGKSLSSGEVAAHLVYSTIMEGDETLPASQETPREDPPQEKSSPTQQGAALHLPQLTEAEKQSPIGASMGYLMGLFFSLRQQLMQQRQAAGNVASADNMTSSSHTNPATGIPSTTPLTTYATVADPNQQAHSQVENAASWGQPVDASQQQHQQTYGTHQDAQPDSSTSSMPHQAAQTLISPSSSATRTNLEESNLMKREMQNQREFQNKMRALKQQELNKYKNVSSSGQQVSHDNPKGGSSDDRKAGWKDAVNQGVRGQTPESGKIEEDSISNEANRSQCAGQSAQVSSSTCNDRSRGASFEAPDDFWNPDAADDHLFEFLMNT